MKSFAALDGIRGYAAMLVTLTHFAGFYAGTFRSLNVERASYWTVPSAVDAVFLRLYLNLESLYLLLTISGWMVCRMVMRPSYRGYGPFLLARAARIYPPLLFALACSVLIGLAFSQPVDLGLRNVAYNVLALNGIFELEGQPYDFPSWSLFYEIVYCLLIPVFIAATRGRCAAITRLAAMWAMFLAGLALLGFSGWMLFLPFAVGCLLAQFEDARLAAAARRIPTGLVICAYVAVTLLPSLWAPLPRIDADGIHVTGRYLAFIALACLMSCLVLVKAVFAEGPLQRLFSWRPLEYLGKVSYSLYLLHAPLIGVVFILAAPVFSRWAEQGGLAHFAMLLAVFWTLTVIAATLGYYLVEMLYFRSSLSSRSKKQPRAPAAAATSTT